MNFFYFESMFQDFDLRYFISDLKLGIASQRRAFDFIKEHRLWIGFWKYGWAARFLMFLGAIVGLKFWSVLMSWWQSAEMSNPMTATASIFSLFKNVSVEGYEMFYIGGAKYLILILMEILIFHFARKTLEILRGEAIDATFKTFVQAEIRMIKIVIRSYILEMILTFLISTLMGMFGLESIKFIPIFLVQCYFLGFVVLDNYNEIFGMSIKESELYARRFVGLAIAIGAGTYILLTIPLIGALVAPLVAGVAATLAMYERTIHEVELELV